MDADIRIQAVGLAQQDLLLEMYDRFDPLAAAFGLPPLTALGRRAWIGNALRYRVNLAAFSPIGEIVGHCFLAADRHGLAELAIFVHQESRERGIGTALVRAALEWGTTAGLRRVWGLTSSENRAALRLLQRCGFRVTKPASQEVELEIELPIPIREADERFLSSALHYIG